MGSLVEAALVTVIAGIASAVLFLVDAILLFNQPPVNEGGATIATWVHDNLHSVQVQYTYVHVHMCGSYEGINDSCYH